MNSVPVRIVFAVLLLTCCFALLATAGPHVAAQSIARVTPDPTPIMQVQITPENVRFLAEAEAITVSWDTVIPMSGWVEYGLSPEGLSSIALSPEGSDHKSQRHEITVSNLEPGTSYYFRIVWPGGVTDADGVPFTLTTDMEIVEHPGEHLPAVKPLPLPLPSADQGYGPIISDDQYLSGFSLDGAELQRVLEESGSVLADSDLIFDDGTRLPAAEAISAWSGVYTLNPPVLLTLAEVEHGLLTRSQSSDGSLTEEEMAALSVWFPETALKLATGFYQIYNAEAEILVTDGVDEPNIGDHMNAGSYAVITYLSGLELPADESTAQRDFSAIFETYFGSPTAGQLYVAHPSLDEDFGNGLEDSALSPETPSQVLGPSRVSLFKFPWVGNDQWNYNGGPHRPGTGSQAYSSLDFQPGGMSGCSVAATRYVTAAASGRVVQNTFPIVTLDHDFDGARGTGWQSQYYHMANNTTNGARPVNSLVKQGDRLGNPSCNVSGGGTATGLHVHFSELYNNVYQDVAGRPLSGWTIVRGSQEYHGYLTRTGYPQRQSGPRPGSYNWDAPDTVLISDNCGLNRYFVEYYNGRLPSTYPAVNRGCVSSINKDWGSGGPGGGIGNDNFSARWVGVVPLFAGRYTFTARADDGVRLWVSGANLVDYWRDQGATNRSGTIDLSSGEKTVEMEYYENGGGAVAQLSYTRSNNTLHTISPLHSNKCLDVAGGSSSDFVAIQQYSCNRTNAQLFYIAKRDGAYYEIRNRNSGKCMDLLNFSTAEGAPIVQYSCHGGYNQQWKLSHVGGKYFQLVSRYSGKCLAVASSSTADSVQLRQYSCQTGNNFLWTINW
jgi:hypothetical protein